MMQLRKDISNRQIEKIRSHVLLRRCQPAFHDHGVDGAALTSVSSAFVLGGWPKARCGARISAHFFPSTVN